MQALLSFDLAPPFAAPFRFFVTAPLFGVLAGLLTLWSGPELFASRWTPAALAFTHLLTVGFMMQVMLGAMMQILPVAAGANMIHPLRVAITVHAVMTVGALALVLGFMTFEPRIFTVAAVSLGLGVTVFITAAARALQRVPSTTPTIRGLKLALLGLGVTVSLGLVLAVSLGGSIHLPLLQLADIHLTWGLVAWASVLLAAVGFVVVPMFQLTPPYPDWFGGRYALAALGSVAAWSAVDLAGWDRLSVLLSGLVVLISALFFLVTLRIQHKSKRAKFDATQHYWRLAMISALIACALWLAGRSLPALGEWRAWPLLLGVLLLVGGLMSVVVGMLYKIVPFLVWLHLQNMGRGRLMAPNMKKVLAEKHMLRQLSAHLAAFALLLSASIWPEWWLVYPAALALIIANLWLLRNLLLAAGVYRNHRNRINALLAAQS